MGRKLSGRRSRCCCPSYMGRLTMPNTLIFREAIDGVRSGRFSGIVVPRTPSAPGAICGRSSTCGGRGRAGLRGRCTRRARTSTVRPRTAACIGTFSRRSRSTNWRSAVWFERSVKGAVERGIWKQRQTPRGYDRHPMIKGASALESFVPDAYLTIPARRCARRGGGEHLRSIASRLGMTTEPAYSSHGPTCVYLGEAARARELTPRRTSRWSTPTRSRQRRSA